MPNDLEQCLGSTGEMIEKSSQNYVAKRLYIREGACLSICARFMCSIVNLEIPKKSDYLEAAQWVQQTPGWEERINLMASSAGLRRTATFSGSLRTDEIYLTQFLSQIHTIPTFYIFGFWNNLRTAGHALLFYRWAGEDWILKDPNFGMAKWSHLGGLMVGLKKLLDSAYSDFGTYRRFQVWKYEK